MLQIDWTQAPEWANFAAMDSDGEWWWYQKEPVKDIDGDYISNGRYKKITALVGSEIKRTISPATLNNMDNY